MKESARLIADELKYTPSFQFGDELRGWVGDNPFVFLDVSKMKDLGWAPSYTIEQSIRETARWLHRNDWIFNERK